MPAETATLPSEFADLEHFVERWARATQRERCSVRWAATMDDIQGLYDTVVRRLDAALQYLKQQPWPLESAADQHLLNLLLALAEVAPAVESFQAPGNPIAQEFTTRYRLIRDDVVGSKEA